MAIITGGASGMGGAISKGLLDEGAYVFIASRRDDTEEKFLKILVSYKDQFCFYETELSKTGENKKLIDQAMKQFNKIDILIHNVGTNDGVKISDSIETFMASIQNNLSHIFNLTHFAIEERIKNQGNILMIGSKIGLTG